MNKLYTTYEQGLFLVVEVEVEIYRERERLEQKQKRNAQGACVRVACVIYFPCAFNQFSTSWPSWCGLLGAEEEALVQDVGLGEEGAFALPLLALPDCRVVVVNAGAKSREWSVAEWQAGLRGPETGASGEQRAVARDCPRRSLSLSLAMSSLRIGRGAHKPSSKRDDRCLHRHLCPR